MKSDKVLKLHSFLQLEGFEIEESTNIEHSTVFRNATFELKKLTSGFGQNKLFLIFPTHLEMTADFFRRTL